jgi:hypothetical protein
MSWVGWYAPLFAASRIRRRRRRGSNKNQACHLSALGRSAKVITKSKRATWFARDNLQTIRPLNVNNHHAPSSACQEHHRSTTPTSNSFHPIQHPTSDTLSSIDSLSPTCHETTDPPTRPPSANPSARARPAQRSASTLGVPGVLGPRARARVQFRSRFAPHAKACSPSRAASTLIPSRSVCVLRRGVFLP